MENTKQRKKKNYKQIGFIASVLFYPLLLFFIFYVVINFNSIIMAFENIDVYGKVTFAGLDNFIEYWKLLTSAQGSLVAISLKNSLLMYFINLIICMPLYILFSYMLYKKCFLNRTIRFIVMIPQVVSSFVICMLFMNFTGSALPDLMEVLFKIENFPNLLRNTKYIFPTTLFYMIWISFSGSLIVYPNAMKEIDSGVTESAQIDGVSNMFQELRYIILPLIFPTLSTFLVTGFAGIFLNCGPLIEFYLYEADTSVYNMGYYFITGVMTGKKMDYPLLSAGGIILTLVSAPLTYLVKFGLDKLDPVED